jgi:hypothetical protein
VRRRERERAVGREKQGPGNDRADEGEGHADPDSAEQPSEQNRRKERHRTEALAHASEEPAQDRSERQERDAHRDAERRPVARQLSERQRMQDQFALQHESTGQRRKGGVAPKKCAARLSRGSRPAEQKISTREASSASLMR